MDDKLFLRGRVALVTGGASGMGRAIALALADAGAEIAVGSLLAGGGQLRGEVSFLPGEQELLRTRQELETRGRRALTANLDVRSTESARAVYEATLAALGPIDILINAAGITAEQTMCGHDDAVWSKVIDVNLNGVYRMIKLCLPGMIARGWGRIINIASTAASVGAPTSAAYCASKAAVVGLTRCVALEGAAHGVTCNAISPGWTNTGFGKIWMAQCAEATGGQDVQSYVREVERGNPQRRLIQPEEIGELAAFLCRERAQGITMQDITVSAGSLW